MADPMDDFLRGWPVIAVAARHRMSVAQTERAIRDRLKQAESDLEVATQALARVRRQELQT